MLKIDLMISFQKYRVPIKVNHQLKYRLNLIKGGLILIAKRAIKIISILPTIRISVNINSCRVTI